MKRMLLALAIAATVGNVAAQAESPAELSDLEIAHVAYVADNIDIRYAHLALAISDNAAVRQFAETMIRDHTAVNEQALALLAKLKAEPVDNFLSKSLVANSGKLIDEMSKLRGADFDRRYAQNELDYHKAVNDLVANSFISNIENAEVRDLFKAGLEIFKAHEQHASTVADQMK